MLGAAAGIITALLTVPKAGREIRDDLGVTARETAERAREAASRAREVFANAGDWVPIFQRTEIEEPIVEQAIEAPSPRPTKRRAPIDATPPAGDAINSHLGVLRPHGSEALPDSLWLAFGRCPCSSASRRPRHPGRAEYRDMVITGGGRPHATDRRGRRRPSSSPRQRRPARCQPKWLGLTDGLPGGRGDGADTVSDGPSATPETPGRRAGREVRAATPTRAGPSQKGSSRKPCDSCSARSHSPADQKEVFPVAREFRNVAGAAGRLSA
jgi:hypothetical protein